MDVALVLIFFFPVVVWRVDEVRVGMLDFQAAFWLLVLGIGNIFVS